MASKPTHPSAEDRAGAVFGALADPTRRALLSALAEHPAATATELAAELPIPAKRSSSISAHSPTRACSGASAPGVTSATR